MRPEIGLATSLDTNARTTNGTDAADLYLDLLKKVLTGTLFEDEIAVVRPSTRARSLLFERMQWLVARQGWEIVRRVLVNRAMREEGGDWPAQAESMAGHRRLENLQQLIRTVIDDEVPGDVLEAGVWRGGASIFARAALEAYGDSERLVWVADSFGGLPKPSMVEDTGDQHWEAATLAVSLEVVRRNFARYGFLDDRVRFLAGWFKDTLPNAPVERLAVLRLDGDMYESTLNGLGLYAKVSPGGFVIIDDYGAVEGCRRAVDDFRRANTITEPLVDVDRNCVYWRKERT